MVTEIEPAFNLLDDLTDAVDYAIVGPRDSRTHEIHTRRFPWNTICHLGRDFGNGRWIGCTGALIAPRMVLTAGHCLYNHRLRRAPARILVTPGRADRDTRPYGSMLAAHFFVPRRYVNSRFPNIADRLHYDYGVIELPRPFSGIAQFMTVQAPSNTELQRIGRDKLFTIAGYPGDKPIGSMWRHTERLRRFTSRRLHYTMDTCPGHSGSPIWYTRRRDGRYAIIGVHTSGIVDERGRAYGCSRGTVVAPPGLLNSGVRMTPEVLENVRRPARAVAGVPQMTKFQ